MSRSPDEERLRLLKALAYRIHRKEEPTQALADCFEAEGRGGKHRQWKQAGQVLAADGFIAALLAGDLVSAEVAAILAVVEKAGNHRLLSDAIEALTQTME